MAARCASPVDDSDHDDQLDELDSSVNPSSVTDRYWVYCWHPQEELLEETYGKWLVFRPKASGELDKIWHVIRQCVETKEFGDGCTAAKCSTAIENPDEAPVGSPKGVICVYTTRKAINDVGLLLIEKVRETIRYKTDETTLRGLYAFKGHGRVTMRTLYWNDGKPSFGPRTLPPDVNPTSVNDDAWVYCKPPLTLAPQSQDSRKNASGNWLVFEPMESLDETWHMIRRALESREFGKGCTGAKCSTAFKHQTVPPNSDGVIVVFTTDEGKNEVGMILIHKVQHNILHKTFESGPPPQTASRRPYSRWSKKPIKTWLYWNNGEPSFEKN
jgi:hypothetical protein